MCGICGIIGSGRLGENDGLVVQQMSRALIHRGPDDRGEFSDANVILAMRRLSIIDLAGGRQPLQNEDGAIVLVANGEIYNYVELRSELQSRGHRFNTGSDCETIVHLYEEDGPKSLNRLRGMFAFALYDRKKQQLMLARDRMGEKPLYLWQDGERLIFSSELKSLIKAVPRSPAADNASIDLFMHYQFVPEPATPIRGIRKLPAANYMLINPRPWQVTMQEYWNPEAVEAIDAEPVSSIRAELENVTSFTLRSDVPVGIALSGGLDSSTIAALSAPKYKGTLHAFTVGYEGSHQCDERPCARSLAGSLRLPFHEIEISTDDFVAAFPELVCHCDDPIADIAGYGYYCVMREARKHNVPVVLTGFGGDELFWGYPWVVNAVRLNIQRFGPRIANGAPQLTFYDLHPDFHIARQVMPYIYTNCFKDTLPERNISAPFTVNAPVDSIPVKICRLLFDNWLIPNCIALGDRLSMASSVELRLPMLDYRLVELAMGLHKANLHSYSLPPKCWLKQAVRPVLTDEILNRPKGGFTPPTRDWMGAAIREYGELIYDGYLVQNNIFDADRVRGFLTNVLSGFFISIAYKMLTLEIWSRAFLAGENISMLSCTGNLTKSFRSGMVRDELAGGQETGICAMSVTNCSDTAATAVMPPVSSQSQPHSCTESQTMIDRTLQQIHSHGPAEQSSAPPQNILRMLLQDEPPQVAAARNMVKSYYQSRLHNGWCSGTPPVWFDHEVDFNLWPKNLFWIERGVFGRLMMRPGCRVLDMCCGDGYYSDVWYSTIAGSIDACDNDEAALLFAERRHANPKIRYRRLDLLSESLPRPPYDVITWFEAIEHFSEKEILLVLDKMRNALVEGGVLVGSTPLVKEIGGHNPQHQKEFTSQDDVARMLKTVFGSVQTWVSIYPERTTCYFRVTK